ncbi:hypothetical protein EW026_g2980 [Hermanssonia centrifuga]|uniref:DUF6535 domain-containing protein n=1 Tax=Hermanssonia centrifuga TaxID=98765 RepID=A0A4S4KM46_9APHY|nr:hypothetical protein EW026_g2980 [Hermanssonia centrifuga]
MTDIPKENTAPIQHTGWASLAKTIRELDEAKMKDCKDDIDTLLIFAGLFSTVMTAFLVESYRNLLIDNNDTMVDLLQQISAQTRGYATSTGFINATDTVTISDPTLPFEPSRDAIRVNVLWFASLIFSLSAASFGMLVKQWLREYMAGDYTSPRVRIRIRQYRHPSLARWKVFEIAAILPLMLQLALGLFFAGLCVFTWSANHHVAYTSMPLVGGWALLFLFATIAPAFSPRCPYKTAFTRRGMKSLRKLLFHSAYFHALDSCCSRLSWRAIKPVIHPRSPNQKEEPSSADRKVEEEDVIQDDGDDISLLATLDGMLRDDDLLPTSIAQALQQMQTDPSDVIKFIFGAVERRIHEDFPLTNTSLPNLQRKLTKYVWNNLVNFTAEVMRTYLNQPRRELQRDSQLPDWMSYALTFLFSLCEHALTKEGEHVIFMCLSFQTDPAIHNGAIRLIASHARGDKVQYGHILGQLRGVFEEIAEADERRRLLLLIERDRLGKPVQSLTDLVKESDSMDDIGLSALLALLMGCTGKQIINYDWPLGTRESLQAIMSSSRIPRQSENNLVPLLTQLMTSRTLFWGVVRYVISSGEKHRSVGQTGQRLIALAFVDAKLDGGHFVA